MHRASGIAICLAGLALGACADGAERVARYEAALSDYAGQSEAELVADWGPPDSVYEAPDGSRYLTYRAQRLVVYPGFAPGWGWGGWGRWGWNDYPFGGIPARADTLWCKTSFHFVADRMVGFRFDGNACRARELEPVPAEADVEAETAPQAPAT